MVMELTDSEDAKLVVLARASRARAKANDGAAVRDTDGRTYAAVCVDLPTLQLSALQVAVAMALSSGVTGLEAAAVVTDALSIETSDTTVVRDFAGPDVPVYRADSSGTVLDVFRT